MSRARITLTTTIAADAVDGRTAAGRPRPAAARPGSRCSRNETRRIRRPCRRENVPTARPVHGAVPPHRETMRPLAAAADPSRVRTNPLASLRPSGLAHAGRAASTAPGERDAARRIGTPKPSPRPSSRAAGGGVRGRCGGGRRGPRPRRAPSSTRREEFLAQLWHCQMVGPASLVPAGCAERFFSASALVCRG